MSERSTMQRVGHAQTSSEKGVTIPLKTLRKIARESTDVDTFVEAVKSWRKEAKSNGL